MFGGALYEDYGGGLFNVNGSQTISNCVFTRNFYSSYASGAAIYSDGGSPLITSTVFTDNYAIQSKGAGIAYEGSGSPVIENCPFIGNAGFTGASIAARGVGIYVPGPSPATTSIVCLRVIE